MTRDELLAIISQLNPEIGQAILSGQISLEELIGEGNPTQDNLLGFDVTRTMITTDRYFENNRIEIIDRNGQLGTLKTQGVWDCGHPQSYPFGGIDSFGHAVCAHCLRFCDRGRHLCCVMDSKILSNGLTVCDCHSGIWRFFKSKFNEMRVR